MGRARLYDIRTTGSMQFERATFVARFSLACPFTSVEMSGSKKAPKKEEEEEEEEDYEPSEAEKAAIMAALRSGNPQLVKALQGRLDGLVGRDSGFIDSLPSKARRQHHITRRRLP